VQREFKLLCKNGKLFNNLEDVDIKIVIFGNSDIPISSHFRNIIPITISVFEKTVYSCPFLWESYGTRGNNSDELLTSIANETPITLAYTVQVKEVKKEL